MKKPAVFVVLCLCSALALAISFAINATFNTQPWGEAENIANVNGDPYVRLYTAKPSTAVGTVALMRFTNGWIQSWRLLNKFLSTPWGPTGPAIYALDEASSCFRLQEGLRCGTSPLVLDMGKNGFDLGPEGRFVSFDLDADGTLDHHQWTRHDGDEAFLARDLNDNGVIDDGTELFGNTGEFKNGFEALGTLDLNRDGYVKGAEMQPLLLWTDHNADARTDEGELQPLPSGMKRLPTIPSYSPNVYINGNWVPYWTLVTPRLQMADVWFKRQ